MNSERKRLAGTFAAGLLLATAGAALGQGGGVQGGGVQVRDRAEPVIVAGEPGQPVIHRAQRESRIERYARVLGLDEVQLEVARDLDIAYQHASAEAGGRLNAAMKDAQADMSEGDHAAFQEKIQRTMREHREASKALTGQYLSDLRALLTSEQQGNWARLERLRRRESDLTGMAGMRGNEIGGAWLDLFPIVARLEVPEDVKPKVDEIMGMYEIDIDRPLQERERNRESDEETMGAVRQFTSETFQRQMDRDRAIDLRVREVNDKYVRLLGAELPDELGARLAEEYRARAYRSAYRPTTAGRELAAAEKLRGLTQKQREQLRAMQEKYQREAKAAGDRLAAAMRRAEDEGRPTGGGLMVMGPGMSGGTADPAVMQARADRRELDARLREEMERMLSPEQLADAREAARPQGATGQRIEVIGSGFGNDMVISTEIDLDDEFDGGPRADAVMIFQTVEIAAPAQQQPPANQNPK
ncbi:MAG: hypothetical protein KF869_00195 [Phycisphaeraceae bacterium]|nr:hypothetical protein [Phycisphaeraceae bacterium]